MGHMELPQTNQERRIGEFGRRTSSSRAVESASDRESIDIGARSRMQANRLQVVQARRRSHLLKARKLRRLLGRHVRMQHVLTVSAPCTVGRFAGSVDVRSLVIRSGRMSLRMLRFCRRQQIVAKRASMSTRLAIAFERRTACDVDWIKCNKADSKSIKTHAMH